MRFPELRDQLRRARLEEDKAQTQVNLLKVKLEEQESLVKEYQESGVCIEPPTQLQRRPTPSYKDPPSILRLISIGSGGGGGGGGDYGAKLHGQLLQVGHEKGFQVT